MKKADREGDGTKKKQKKSPSQDFLEPITSKRKVQKFLVYDIESKAGNTQKAGFTRPFMVGMLVPDELGGVSGGYQEFRDEPHLRTRCSCRRHCSCWERWHIEPGGCIDKLLNVILTKKYSGYSIYAHNGGNFDHLFLLTWLQEHRDEFGFRVVPVQSSIQLLEVWRLPLDESGEHDPEGEITERWSFVDSMKLIPYGLDKACTAFKVENKKQHNLDLHEDDPSWGEYLFQDCKSLALVMLRFYQLIWDLGGEVGITTASTAMKLFRRKFLGQNGTPNKIARYSHWKDCLGKDDESCSGCALRWVLDSYCGGRTEIFEFFAELLHYMDINSSYVASMRYDMPIGDRKVEDGGSDGKTIRWSRHRSKKNPGGNYAGFCECEVYIPEDCPIPPLPKRSLELKKLIFPTGYFRGIWSLEELALLEDPIVGGRIERVIKTVWFRLKPLFLDMVTELWKFRDKKRKCGSCEGSGQNRGDGAKCSNCKGSGSGYDEGMSELAKLLGNSSYGKFAMKQERSSVVFVQKVENNQCFLCRGPVGGAICGAGAKLEGGLCAACHGSKPAMNNAEGDVWYQAQRVDAPYIIPHIAAHITSLSRVSLWRYMRQALTTLTKEEPVEEVFRGYLEPVKVSVKDRFVFVKPGRVIFHDGGPVMVLDVTKMEGRGYRALVRPLGEEGGGELDVIFGLSVSVGVGGRVYYTDTDSILTDATLPTSTNFGEIKDEYPGELLRFSAMQPKVYMIEKMGHNKEVERVTSVLDPEDMPFPAKFFKPHSKVTMKGFPQRMRTKENLEKLKAGESLSWEQLEKVRSLARTGFRRPPKMREGDTGPKNLQQVTKSFRSGYDKRVVLPDGRTRAVVLDERELAELAAAE